MILKLIVMLVSVVRGRVQERTRNFGHLVHETWPRTCVRSVFKFYKKTNEVRKSWNLLRYRDIIYGGYDKNFRRFRARCHVRCLPPRRPLQEIMKLLRRFFGLQASYVTTCAKPAQIFITASPYEIMTSWQVSWFSDFVCFL